MRITKKRRHEAMLEQGMHSGNTDAKFDPPPEPRMTRSKHQQMRDAINDVELALNGLEIDSVVRLWENAHDSVMVKLPLGALRQLARCYPAVNRIINDPSFERASRE
jgi:hypothetical protein